MLHSRSPGGRGWSSGTCSKVGDVRRLWCRLGSSSGGLSSDPSGRAVARGLSSAGGMTRIGGLARAYRVFLPVGFWEHARNDCAPESMIFSSLRGRLFLRKGRSCSETSGSHVFSEVSI